MKRTRIEIVQAEVKAESAKRLRSFGLKFREIAAILRVTAAGAAYLFHRKKSAE